MTEPHITLPRLGLTLGLVLIAVLVSRRQRLDLEKDLLWGGLRGAIQLLAVGYGLTLLFRHESGVAVCAVLALMATAAAAISVQRLEHGPGPRRLFPFALMAITGAVATALVPVFFWIVPLRPWFDARYVVPMAGILLSGAMNVVTLVFARIFRAAEEDRDEIEVLLSLGSDGANAIQRISREALRTALIPTINSLFAVGIVTLPGMMTGQIVGGAAPSEAVKFQLIVLYQIVAVAALAGAFAARLARGLLFDECDRLAVEPQVKEGASAREV